MPVRSISMLLCSVAATGALVWAGVANTQARQTVTPPKARYAMDATTASGLAGMGKGAGSALSMMLGGGSGGETRDLVLRLGSTLPATGTPTADHFPTAALKAGRALPLVSAVPGGRGLDAPGPRDDFQRPKARMLIFWGCGERAPRGQPVIIDFTKIMAGQMPPALFTTNVPVEPGPTLRTSRTYGEWPNPKSNRLPGRGATLIGEHRVAGNYTPEMRFTLTQDWMPALNARNQALPGGATMLAWNQLAPATGYYAWAFGAGGEMQGEQPTDLVWWASSLTREFGGGLTEWLPPATVAGLVTKKVVMPPSQTSCAIPAEVRRAAPTFMMASLYAYGPEENFIYPPRPADVRTPWNQLWAAKVRHRSMSMTMIGGPDMGDLGQRSRDDRPPPPKKCRGVGGILGGVLSGRGC